MQVKPKHFRFSNHPRDKVNIFLRCRIASSINSSRERQKKPAAIKSLWFGKISFIIKSTGGKNSGELLFMKFTYTLITFKNK